MKRTTVLLALCLLFLNVSSQEIIRVDDVIYNKQGEVINKASYYQDDSFVECNYQLYAQNNDYQYITSYVTFYSGNSSGLIELLESILNFGEKHIPGTSANIQEGLSIYVQEVIGIKYVSLSNDSGHHDFSLKKLAKMKDFFAKYVANKECP